MNQIKCFLVCALLATAGCDKVTPYSVKIEDGELKGIAHSDPVRVYELTFEFKASKDGSYLIESWRNPHRAPNRLVNEYYFPKVEKGFSKSLEIGAGVYRIDVIYIGEDSFNRSVVYANGNAGAN